SNTAPTIVASGTATGSAVYGGQSGPADIMLAGGLSPYGTMAQGGNVYEWEETDEDLVNGPTVTSSYYRGVRGGNWITPANNLTSSLRIGDHADDGGAIGFRVASTGVPEPSTLVLALGIFAPLAAYRRCRS